LRHPGPEEHDREQGRDDPQPDIHRALLPARPCAVEYRTATGVAVYRVCRGIPDFRWREYGTGTSLVPSDSRPCPGGVSMRAIWKGSITFGLVNVPISVYSATESHDLRLHQVHDKDGGRIRYQRRCEVCGEVVEWGEINKAYDDGDRTVVISDEELSELPTERSREI